MFFFVELQPDSLYPFFCSLFSILHVHFACTYKLLCVFLYSETQLSLLNEFEIDIKIEQLLFEACQLPQRLRFYYTKTNKSSFFIYLFFLSTVCVALLICKKDDLIVRKFVHGSAVSMHQQSIHPLFFPPCLHNIAEGVRRKGDIKKAIVPVNFNFFDFFFPLFPPSTVRTASCFEILLQRNLLYFQICSHSLSFLSCLSTPFLK